MRLAVAALLFVTACATERVAVKSAPQLQHERACVRDIVDADDKAAMANCDLCLEYDPRDADCLNQEGVIWMRMRHNNERAKQFCTYTLELWNIGSRTTLHSWKTLNIWFQLSPVSCTWHRVPKSR